MEQTIIDKFNQLWPEFVSQFRGSMKLEAKKQPIDYALACLLLKDAASTWTSEYSVGGRWLMGLRKDDEERGQKVYDLLSKGLKLKEVEMAKPLPSMLNVAVPVAAGGVGYAVAAIAKMGTIGSICATGVPMLAAYPLMQNLAAQRKVKANEDAIDAYTEQLSQYADAVIDILKS